MSSRDCQAEHRARAADLGLRQTSTGSCPRRLTVHVCARNYLRRDRHVTSTPFGLRFCPFRVTNSHTAARLERARRSYEAPCDAGARTRPGAHLSPGLTSSRANPPGAVHALPLRRESASQRPPGGGLGRERQ